MPTEHEIAVCRGCGRELQGKQYWQGGHAYHPDTGERCKVNFYGGYVCSESCDRRASLELEGSMPGHSGKQTTLSCYAQERLRSNWTRE